MDAKAEMTKLWKEIQDSAKEFASFGLQVSSRALDFTAGTLSSLKQELARTAEKLHPDKPKAEGEGEGEPPPEGPAKRD